VNCAACGSPHTVAGGFVHRRSTRHFRPARLRRLALIRSVRLSFARMQACLHCGHVWNECNAEDLRDLIDVSASAELLDELRRRAASTLPPGTMPATASAIACPTCHDPVTVGGSASAEQPGTFRPDDLKTTAWASALPLKYLGNRSLLSACTSCGHVWGAVNAAALLALVQKSATDALRARLQRLGANLP
jgi:hypothetical protein